MNRVEQKCHFHNLSKAMLSWNRIEFHCGTTSSRFHTEYRKKLECHHNLFWQSKNILACNFPFRLAIQIFFDVPVLPIWHFERCYFAPCIYLYLHQIPTKISFQKGLSKCSFRNKICPNVPQVSCKGGTSSFRYGIRHVDWLGWSAYAYFPSTRRCFISLSFQNETFYANVDWTMCVVVEWKSFRHHVNTTEANFWICTNLQGPCSWGKPVDTVLSPGTDTMSHH